MDDESGAAGPSARAGNRHVNRSGRHRQHSPQLRGAPMAEHGMDPARCHRREPPSLIAQGRMANGVHPAVEPMQSTCGNPAGDAFGGKAGFEQLLDVGDAVLAPGDPGHHQVGGGDLLAHTANKSPAGRGAP